MAVFYANIQNWQQPTNPFINYKNNYKSRFFVTVHFFIVLQQQNTKNEPSSNVIFFAVSVHRNQLKDNVFHSIFYWFVCPDMVKKVTFKFVSALFQFLFLIKLLDLGNWIVIITWLTSVTATLMYTYVVEKQISLHF